MAYSELHWRPFLGHQAWSWTTLRRGNVFITFTNGFYFCHVFNIFNVLYFYLNVFYMYRLNEEQIKRFVHLHCCCCCSCSCIGRQMLCRGLDSDGPAVNIYWAFKAVSQTGKQLDIMPNSQRPPDTTDSPVCVVSGGVNWVSRPSGKVWTVSR